MKVNFWWRNLEYRQMSDMPTHPSRHVVVAGGGGGPVEHLLEAASLEGHDAQHHQADGDALQKVKCYKNVTWSLKYELSWPDIDY